MGKFHVAICGGGIGGLTTAVALSKYPNIDVDIYEAATEFSEVGAGIGIWPRVWRLLAKLGLDEELAGVSALQPTDEEVDTFIFRKADQPEGLDFYTLRTRGSFIRYHRADFLRVLVNNIPSRYKTHFNHRLERYTRSSPSKVDLYFGNGVTTTCDVLIGSDGVKSAVRQCLLTEKAKIEERLGNLEEAQRLLNCIEPKWTGIVAYRALVPTDRLKNYKDKHPDLSIRIPLPDSLPIMYMGQHVNVVVYPISSGKLINVGAFHATEELAGTPFPGPWVSRVGNAELLKAHEHYEGELKAILECVDRPSRWAIHIVADLKTWVHGNVALLGDAAHAMSPQQASGAGQAIEDAFILATLLGNQQTSAGTVHRALTIYDEIRRPVAADVQRRSLENGRLFGLQLTGLDPSKGIRMELLSQIGGAIKENWEWTWTTSLDEDVQKAVKLLEQEIDATPRSKF